MENLWDERMDANINQLFAEAPDQILSENVLDNELAAQDLEEAEFSPFLLESFSL